MIANKDDGVNDGNWGLGSNLVLAFHIFLKHYPLGSEKINTTKILQKKSVCWGGGGGGGHR